MTLRDAWNLLKDSAAAWTEDRAPSQGAALAYYTAFSIAPLLLIVISVAGIVFGADAARGAVVAQLQGMVGTDAAQAVEGLLESASEPKEGVISTLIGVLLLIIGATTVLAELQDALDRIWDAPERARPHGLWGWLRSRIVTIGMILAIGFLLLVSLVVSTAITSLGEWWGPLFGGWEALATTVSLAFSFALITVLFALIYKFLPHVKIQWHDVWIGAGATALMFTLGKYLISLYIGKASVTSGFGAAGSLVVLLVWVYYSAQIFLLGAQFTALYARRYGSHQRASAAKASQQSAQGAAAPSISKPRSLPHAACATAIADVTPPAPGRLGSRLQRNPVPVIGAAMLMGAGSALIVEVLRRALLGRRRAA